MNLQTDRNVFQAKPSLFATWPWVSREIFAGASKASIRIFRSMPSAVVLVEVVMLTALLMLRVQSKTRVGMDSMVSSRIKRVSDSRL